MTLASVTGLFGLGMVALMRGAPVDAAEVFPQCVAQGEVVALYSDYHQYRGTASVVGHDSGRTYMVTAWHVVNPEWGAAESCIFGVFRVDKSDTHTDLAIISVPAEFGVAWEISEEYEDGDEVQLTGHIFGAAPVRTWGHVSNKAMNWLDSSVHPGMSGGPIAVNGRLIGVTLGYIGPGTLTIFAPACDIKWIMEGVYDGS